MDNNDELQHKPLSTNDSSVVPKPHSETKLVSRRDFLKYSAATAAMLLLGRRVMNAGVEQTMNQKEKPPDFHIEMSEYVISVSEDVFSPDYSKLSKLGVFDEERKCFVNTSEATFLLDFSSEIFKGKKIRWSSCEVMAYRINTDPVQFQKNEQSPRIDPATAGMFLEGNWKIYSDATDEDEFPIFEAPESDYVIRAVGAEHYLAESTISIRGIKCKGDIVEKKDEQGGYYCAAPSVISVEDSNLIVESVVIDLSELTVPDQFGDSSQICRGISINNTSLKKTISLQASKVKVKSGLWDGITLNGSVKSEIHDCQIEQNPEAFIRRGVGISSTHCDQPISIKDTEIRYSKGIYLSYRKVDNTDQYSQIENCSIKCHAWAISSKYCAIENCEIQVDQDSNLLFYEPWSSPASNGIINLLTDSLITDTSISIDAKDQRYISVASLAFLMDRMTATRENILEEFNRVYKQVDFENIVIKIDGTQLKSIQYEDIKKIIEGFSDNLLEGWYNLMSLVYDREKEEFCLLVTSGIAEGDADFFSSSTMTLVY